MRCLPVAFAVAAIPLATAAQEASGLRRVAPPGASSCSGCHASRPAAGLAVPWIAGRPAAEIADLMAAFRAGERSGTVMTRIARGFSPEETRAIAEWLEGQR
ncbi:cytochrome C [Enterovirga sp. DB1703]|uniref:Cytochrome C n=1 Tax=Enterovirga aerilata TaxID=2730920 RepID=A0A849IBD2_9HYPH|nr:cytochrome C [Enterovirga sp. DB1703]NNM73350.1 cytochrome C [Enterovirga sp. DB1703]